MQAQDPLPPPLVAPDAQPILLTMWASMRDLINSRLDQMDERLNNLEVKTDAMFDENQEI